MASFYENINIAKKYYRLMLWIFAIGYCCIVVLLTYTIQLLYNSYENLPREEYDLNIFHGKSIYISIIIVTSLMIYGYLKAYKELKNNINGFNSYLGGISLSLLLQIKNITNNNYHKFEKYISNYELEILKDIDTNELQTLKNVVEEMSISAKIPCPRIFIDLMNQDINAYSLCYNSKKSCIGVSYGALKQLKRDELQSLIAFEFSAICNGCTEASVKTSALISAMTIIFNTGLFFVPLSDNENSSYNYESNKKNKSNIDGVPGLIPILFICAILMSIGAIGQAFGYIMKSLISKKMIMLCDATTIKYTRNPVALLTTLDKTLIHNTYTQYINPNYSQLYFVCSILANNTHPKTKDRMNIIDYIAHEDPNIKYEYYDDYNKDNSDINNKTIKKNPEKNINLTNGAIVCTANAIKETVDEVERISNKIELAYNYKILGTIFNDNEQYQLFYNQMEEGFKKLLPPEFLLMEYDELTTHLYLFKNFVSELDDYEANRFINILNKAQNINKNNLKPSLLSIYLAKKTVENTNKKVFEQNYGKFCSFIFSYILNYNKNIPIDSKEQIFSKAYENIYSKVPSFYLTNVKETSFFEALKEISWAEIDFKKNFGTGFKILQKELIINYESQNFILAFINTLINDNTPHTLNEERITTPIDNTLPVNNEPLTKTYGVLLNAICLEPKHLDTYKKYGDEEFIKSLNEPSKKLNSLDVRKILIQFINEYCISSYAIRSNFYRIISSLVRIETSNTKLLAFCALLSNKNQDFKLDIVNDKYFEIAFERNNISSEFKKNAIIIFKKLVYLNKENGINYQEMIYGALDLLDIAHNQCDNTTPSYQQVFQALLFMTKVSKKYQEKLLLGLKAIIDADFEETPEEIFTYEVIRLLQSDIIKNNTDL
ncbi:MAG: M48 family metalloprotease [Succinivibrionaceae bacterium]